MLSIAVLAVTACDLTSSNNTGSNPGQKNTAVVSPPSSINSENQNNNSFGGVPPLEIRQGGSLGSLGLNLETLFVQNLNTDDRITRLENAIVAVQGDLRTLAPSMQRMAIIEKDLEALVGQLESLLQEESAMPAIASTTVETDEIAPPGPIENKAPLNLTSNMEPSAETPIPKAAPDLSLAVVAQPAAPEIAPAPAPSPDKTTATGLIISDLRLGEHTNKTRLVFDMSGTASFRTDLDNAEKILIVEIDKAAWSESITKKISSPLVQSYTVQNLENNAGTRVILTLKKDARIASESVLAPEPAANNHRLVIDLAYE